MKKRRIIGWLLLFSIILGFIMPTQEVEHVHASTAGTAVYGSGASNGSVQDVGWIIVMDKVLNKYKSGTVPSEYKNAETATMDEYRNKNSYLDSTSNVWFDGLTKNSVLIVDKSSYSSSITHWYCNGTDKNGANKSFNTKTKVYTNYRGEGGAYTFTGYLLTKMKDAVQTSGKPLTPKEWKEIYKANQAAVKSGAETLRRNFNNFGSLDTNLKNYIEAGVDEVDPTKDTTYLRYVDLLSIVNYLSGDKYTSYIESYLEHIAEGDSREEFIELFFIPVIATTGTSSNDRLWYNAASWYAFVFQTSLSNFTKTAVGNNLLYVISTFTTESANLVTYRETDLKKWYERYGGAPASSSLKSLANNNSIWSKYVISGNGNLTNFSDERNLRYTAFAVSQAKVTAGKVLNSNSGYTFFSAGQIIKDPDIKLNPCGGIALSVKEPTDGNGTIDDFTEDHLSQEVANILEVSFVVNDEAAVKKFYDYFSKTNTYSNVSAEINLNIKLKEDNTKKETSAKAPLIDKASMGTTLTTTVENKGVAESNIKITGIKELSQIKRIISATPKEPVTLKLTDQNILLSKETMIEKKGNYTLEYLYTIEGTISVTYTKGGKTETYTTTQQGLQQKVQKEQVG